MCSYIKLCANRLAVALDFEPLYDETEANNPFDWMELISLQGKTNFFEKRVGEYQRAGVMESLKEDPSRNQFNLEADF
jgi:ribonucleotide reductase beta subunit family protein with ferritin-like domain